MSVAGRDLFRPGNISSGLQGNWKFGEMFAHAYTGNGSAQLDTAQFKFGTASFLGDGVNSTVTYDYSDDWNFRYGDFTIEFFVRFNSTSGTQNLIDRNGSSVFAVIKDTSGTLRVEINATTKINATWSPSTGTWYHVAVVRYNNILRAFVDGIQVGSDANSEEDINSATDALQVGGNAARTATLNGWLDEVRISKKARYTSTSLTVPTGAFTTDEQTALLLHFDGSDASTTFTDSSGTASSYADSSANENALTRTNKVDVEREHYWNNGEVSALFDRSNSQYATVTDPAGGELDFAGTYSAACWIKINTGSISQFIFGKRVSSTGYDFSINSSNQLVVIHDATTYTSVGTVDVGVWMHIGFVYNTTANTITFFFNGDAEAAQAATQDPSANSTDFYVGSDATPASYLDGSIKDLGLWNTALTSLNMKSLALGQDLSSYTFRPDDSSLTTPTSHWKMNELIASGARADSAGSHNLTDNDSDIACAGGYIEGAGAKFLGSVSNSWLDLASHADFQYGNGDFSIAGFWKFNSVSDQGLISKWINAGQREWEFGLSSGALRFKYSTNGTATAGTLTTTTVGTLLKTGAWYHIAIVRDGTTVTIYVDGVADATTLDVSTDTFHSGTDELRIGSSNDLGGQSGTIASDLATWKGTALSTEEVSSLACGLDINAIGLVSYWKGQEKIAKSVTANGDVHTDTSIKKFGTASAEFDGTGDYLTVPFNPDWNFGTGDFTIDFFIRFKSVASTVAIFDIGEGVTGNGIEMEWAAPTGRLEVNIDAVDVAGANQSLSADTWYHIEVSRSGSAVKIFVDGTEIASGTSSANLFSTSDTVKIGRRGVDTNFMLNGYIDEFRISNVARHTSNFTPETAAYDTDGNTLLLLHMDGTNGAMIFTDSSVTTDADLDLLDEQGNNDLTNNNTVLYSVSGRVGGARFLQQANSEYFSIANTAHMMLNTKFKTVGIWWRPTTTLGDLINKDGGAAPAGWSLLSDNTDETSFQLGNGGTTLTGAGIVINDWFHAAGSWDGKTIRNFTNGRLHQTSTTTDGKSQAADPVYIGAQVETGPTSFVDGLLCEGFYFCRALTPTELKALVIKGKNGKELTSTEQESAGVSGGGLLFAA